MIVPNGEILKINCINIYFSASKENISCFSYTHPVTGSRAYHSKEGLNSECQDKITFGLKSKCQEKITFGLKSECQD